MLIYRWWHDIIKHLFIFEISTGLLNNPALASQYPTAFLQMAAAAAQQQNTAPILASQLSTPQFTTAGGITTQQSATYPTYSFALNSSGNTTVNRIPPMYSIKGLLSSPSQVDIEKAKLIIKKEGRSKVIERSTL